MTTSSLSATQPYDATENQRMRPSQAAAPRETVPSRPSKRALWAGRTLSGVACAFLLFDAGMKLLLVAPAVTGTAELGYPTHVLRPLGIVQLVCWIAYVFPPTSVLGAVLWTGYLGGAIATHVRLDNPLWSHQLFPIYVAALLWGGLWLRNPRLRALLPLTSVR